MYAKGKTFTEHINEEDNKPNQKSNLFNPPTTDSDALYFLKDYLLGENWYDVNPVSNDQINTQMVHEILMKYSRKYRKERKKFKKELEIKQRLKTGHW